MKLLISIYLALSLSFACDETNLFKSNKGFSSIPVADQDSIGACYAYVATQILDTERFNSGVSTSKRTHPLWVAYNYKDKYDSNDTSIEAGGTHSAIKSIFKAGICHESRGQALIYKYKKSNNLSDAQFMNIVENAYRLQFLSSVDDIHYSKADKKEIISCERVTESDSAIRIMNSLKEEFKDISKNLVPKLVLGEIFKNCKEEEKYLPRADIDNLKSSECSNCTHKELAKYLQKQLKRNKPVAISYCSEVLSDKSYKGIVDDNPYIPFEKRSNRKEGCSGHASIIAGARKNAGKCEFLLKNSWGDWKSNTWKDCMCETSKGVYEACKRGDKKINSVGCWIDASTLSKSIYDTVHF